MFGLFKKKQPQKIEPPQNWQQAYERCVERDLEYMKTSLVEKQSNYIKDMMSTFKPDSTVENYINDALTFAFTRHHFDLQQAYLECAIQRADLVLDRQHPNWHNQHWPQDLQPRYYSSIAILHAYSVAWYHNKEIDTAVLNQHSKILFEYCLNPDYTEWDDYTQSWYLIAVWDLMITGDLDAAARAIQVKKRFKWVKRFYEWTKALIEHLQQQDLSQDELKTFFDEPFDVIKGYRWMLDDKYDYKKGYDRADLWFVSTDKALIRLRLAVLRWKYIEQKTIEDNWTQVLQQIGDDEIVP
ncbi:hypothetical protein [Acinetobacter boissieri]|uniref:Uncharacterized protein n=1 Tax=Acinetobacter boissieri TaxID=1219383 RepID=A0A1G6JSY9_9GAMM|nr:hypothetical protein [Acinetobacter boissieri]SDC21852.1 hypothetical protein SAMN05421733_11257 [Acinetobacter boissieri]